MSSLWVGVIDRDHVGERLDHGRRLPSWRRPQSQQWFLRKYSCSPAISKRFGSHGTASPLEILTHLTGWSVTCWCPGGPPSPPHEPNHVSILGTRRRAPLHGQTMSFIHGCPSFVVPLSGLQSVTSHGPLSVGVCISCVFKPRGEPETFIVSPLLPCLISHALHRNILSRSHDQSPLGSRTTCHPLRPLTRVRGLAAEFGGCP